MIGIPNPLLFGLLAGALRFVPFIGSFIAAAFPIALSLAVAPGWTMPLLTVGLFVILEPIVANVVEPWLYGSSTGLSPLAILVAAIFWTTLWGPVGLLLATPLTVCLVVLGRYVPPLHFLDVLLGDRPVLPPEAKLYQRMLAHDPDEAIQIIHEFNKDEPKPLVEIYDGLVLKALMLAEQDRQLGGLDDRAQENILEVVGEIIEAWSDYADPPPEGEEAGEQAVLPERRIAAILSQKTAVLCIGARNDIDEATAELLIHLVRRRGIIAGTLSCEAVNIRNIGHLDRDGVNLICLSYLAPNMIHAGRLARRLHGHFGDHVGIMIGFWGATAHDGDAEGVRGLDKVGIVTTLGDACAAIVKDMAPLVQAETAR